MSFNPLDSTKPFNNAYRRNNPPRGPTQTSIFKAAFRALAVLVVTLYVLRRCFPPRVRTLTGITLLLLIFFLTQRPGNRGEQPPVPASAPPYEINRGEQPPVPASAPPYGGKAFDVIKGTA